MTANFAAVRPLGPPAYGSLADVEALTRLLDIMANFPSNEQRARYILSSNWMRDRTATADPAPDCSHCEEPITGVPLSDANDAFWQRTRRVFCSVDCHQNYAERQMQP